MLENRILYKLLLISLILFIFSELFLFISYFWIYFHNINPITNIILISDPCKLTYVNIILLSIISINISILYGRIFIYNILSFSILFIILFILEYYFINFYINDNFYNNIFFYITELHALHLVFGIILISIYYSSPPAIALHGLNLEIQSPCHYNLCITSGINLSFTLLYFHFIEILWIIISLLLYSLWLILLLFQASIIHLDLFTYQKFTSTLTSFHEKNKFYTTVDGKCPIADFINSLNGKQAQKVAWVF